MAVIIFCGVAGKVLLADYRRLLVNGLNLTQPSFVYAYLALLVQSGKHLRLISPPSPSHVCFSSRPAGFLQLIGCLGALRLSEKLLNAYWLLLLILLLGDAILGIFWMFKFDRIMQELQPMLRLVTQSIKNMQKTLSCRRYDTKPTYNKTRHDLERGRYFRLSFYWNRSLRRIDIDGAVVGAAWDVIGRQAFLGWLWGGSKVSQSEGRFIKNVSSISRVSMSHNPQTHPTFIHIFSCKDFPCQI
jgi:hypothetical protein